MSKSIAAELKALKTAKIAQLKERYAELFGEPAKSRDRAFLFRRIAAKLQKPAEETAAPPPVAAPAEAAAPATKKAPKPRDARLPQVGAVISRTYREKQIEVLCLDDGFEYEGAKYRTLSRLAMKVTGAKSVNGFLFFRLIPKKPKDAKEE